MTKRILITGGASGLGLALATHYARQGHRVLITDINDERGEAITKKPGGLPGAHYEHADTRDPAAWQRLHEIVRARWGGLDILVNNAGVAGGGRVELLAQEEWDWIFEINVMGVVHGVRTFVPCFKQQRSGHIVNVASLAAIANPPGLASYSATKAAVLSLSETLRTELAPYGVRTTVACPSFFQTNLLESLRTPERVLGDWGARLLSNGSLSCEQVAARIARAVRKGQFLVLPHPEAKAAYALKCFARPLYDRVAYKLGELVVRRLEANQLTPEQSRSDSVPRTRESSLP